LLIKDVRNGKVLKDFINNYDDIKVDVLTIAETKAAIEANEGKLINIDSKLKIQIKIVLDFISRQLRHVPNSRRKEITLGEFINKFNHLDSQSL
jgi:hypothetical protein